MNKLASVRQVANAAKEMPDTFLRCRDLGHQWRMYYQRKEGVHIVRRLYCPSCKTDRKVKINRYGEVVSNSYDYDTGYLVSGLGRVQGRSKTAFRVESINRIDDFEDYTIKAD